MVAFHRWGWAGLGFHLEFLLVSSLRTASVVYPSCKHHDIFLIASVLGRIYHRHASSKDTEGPRR